MEDLEQEPIQENIVQDRYRNRRTMAWLAFWLIAGVGMVLLSFGLYSDQNAARVDALSMFIGTIFGIWIAIITWYFGATTVTDNSEIRK